MKNSFLIAITCITFLSSIKAQQVRTITDVRDGKSYKTVQIGFQTWIAEDLAFKTRKGCFINKDSLTYGYHYSWKTTKKVCPKGWHLPTIDEWKTLIKYLGGESIAGGSLKEKGTSHWHSPNAGATNYSGFNAQPNDWFLQYGTFEYIDLSHNAIWWSSSIKKDYGKSNRYINVLKLDYSYWGVDFNWDYSSFGKNSVRCLKDYR